MRESVHGGPELPQIDGDRGELALNRVLLRGVRELEVHCRYDPRVRAPMSLVVIIECTSQYELTHLKPPRRRGTEAAVVLVYA